MEAGLEIRTMKYVRCSDLFKGCGVALSMFADSEPDCTWGDNEFSCVKFSTIIGPLQELLVELPGERADRSCVESFDLRFALSWRLRRFGVLIMGECYEYICRNKHQHRLWAATARVLGPVRLCPECGEVARGAWDASCGDASGLAQLDCGAKVHGPGDGSFLAIPRDTCDRVLTELWHAITDSVCPVYAEILPTMIRSKATTHGVDINTVNSRGETMLYAAALADISEIVEVLLQYGADPDVDCTRWSRDASGPISIRDRAVWAAIRCGSRRSIPLLAVSDVVATDDARFCAIDMVWREAKQREDHAEDAQDWMGFVEIYVAAAYEQITAPAPKATKEREAQSG